MPWDGSGHAYQPILETSYTLGHRILRQAQRTQNWDSLIFLFDAHGSTRALLTKEGYIASSSHTGDGVLQRFSCTS